MLKAPKKSNLMYIWNIPIYKYTSQTPQYIYIYVCVYIYIYIWIWYIYMHKSYIYIYVYIYICIHKSYIYMIYMIYIYIYHIQKSCLTILRTHEMPMVWSGGYNWQLPPSEVANRSAKGDQDCPADLDGSWDQAGVWRTNMVIMCICIYIYIALCIVLCIAKYIYIYI